jgi:starch-binding outer membrane protein, SusD/RagB family
LLTEKNEKMKRLYIPLVLIVAITAGMTTGCSKDFLEKPKGGAVTVDTIFHTQKQAQYAVADMYNYCIPTGFVMNSSADSREDVLTDQVHLLLPGAAWVGGNLNYQYYVAGGMAPTFSIDRGPIPTRGNTGAVAFTGWYKAIRKANLVLKNIDAVSDAPADWKADVKAQALFCRAIAHYSAFRMYGGVPIVSSVLSGDGTIAIPRASIQSLVDSLVSWCDMAASVLPVARPSTDYGKVTSLAALALKARILLYAASPLYNTPDNMKSAISGARFNDARDSVLCYPTYSKERWKRAADAAKAVIDAAPASFVYFYSNGKPTTKTRTDNYAGLGDYEAVCNNVDSTGKYGNSEMILVNTYNQNDPNRDGWADWGRYNFSKVRMMGWGAKNDVPVEFLQAYEKRDGSKWTATATGTDFKTYFEGLNLDPRAYQSLAWAGQWYNSGKTFLAYYKASTDNTSYAKGSLVDDTNAGDTYGSAIESSKFVARVDNNNDNHFAWPVFRLAEFYLSYAEALNEYGGPSGEAFTYLNLIRRRAGMPDKDATILPDQESFRAAVQNERSIELAFEDHRYNDLHRWLKAHLVLNQTLHGFAVTASTNGVTPKPTNPFLNWSIVSYGARTFPVKYYYVPFPYSEISMMYLGGKGWDGQNPAW